MINSAALFTASSLHASASTPHSCTHPAEFRLPGQYADSFLEPPHQVDCERHCSWAEPSGAAPLPRLGIQKEYPLLSQVGSKVKCIELMSTTTSSSCDVLHSLLRTSRRGSSFSSGRCYGVPFRSIYVSGTVNGWMVEQKPVQHSRPRSANWSTTRE